MEEKDITIFYSWQSDLPAETNKDAIEEALQNSKTDLENDIPNIKLNIDDAVRNTTGSININESILDKISNCDIFICDVTPINHQLLNENSSTKALPNPNVMFELGFAVSKLGWERIWLLYNHHYCSSLKLPFDIGNNFTHGYFITPKKDGKYIQNLANLTTSLTEKLKNIILKNPSKGYDLEKLDPERIRRQNDIDTVRRLFETIHIKTIEEFLLTSPSIVNADFFVLLLSFVPQVTSLSFYLHDKRLRMLIEELYSKFKNLMPYLKYYKQIANTETFCMDMYSNFTNEESIDKFNDNKKLMEKFFKNLIHYVKENYIEIDLDKANKIALQTIKDRENLVYFSQLQSIYPINKTETKKTGDS